MKIFTEDGTNGRFYVSIAENEYVHGTYHLFIEENDIVVHFDLPRRGCEVKIEAHSSENPFADEWRGRNGFTRYRPLTPVERDEIKWAVADAAVCKYNRREVL